jgi:hypothetical protein
MPTFTSMPFKPLSSYFNTTYLGDDDDWYVGSGGADRVDAGRGSDYVSTGDGNDRIWANGNDSTWRGDAGGIYGSGGTIIDAGWGDDHVSLGTDARPSLRGYLGQPDGGGAFHVQTGDGQDRVSVYDVDYVSIYAHDGDTMQDTFFFASSFNGDAVISGVDTFDRVELRGGDWDLTSTAGGQLLYENDTGGSVAITGITHGINDPMVIA